MPPINPYYNPNAYQYPPTFQPFQQPMVQAPQQNDVYVHGEQAAQSYPIQPGSTLRLWDDTADIFYMKTADQAGNITLRIFDYTERGTTQPMQTQQQPQPDFQEAIDKLDDKFQRQINRLNSIIGNLRKDGVING
jgi:hypothetical protein